MEETTMATFSERITELIAEKEISSQALAGIVGVNRTAIDSWKRGAYQIYLSHAIILADFFECSLDYLMGLCHDERINKNYKTCPPFYLRFLAVLEERNLSKYRLRLDSPIKGGHLSKWKTGSDPLMPTLITAAKYLDVSLDYLVGRDF